MGHQRYMLHLFYILSQSYLMVTQVSSSDIPECTGYIGRSPNDSVHCEGFLDSGKCKNNKECCKVSQQIMHNSCFNMSVLEAYGLWKRPTPAPTLKAVSPCSRNDFVSSQDNYANTAIDGHVIIQYKALTVMQCSDFCLREPRCRGFNVAIVGDPEGRVCELLEHDDKIVDRQGFRFWFFDRMSYEETFLMPRYSLQEDAVQDVLKGCQ